jgi:2-dehydro-3-deoxyglucarate aldolase
MQSGFKSELAAGQTKIGSWITLANPAIAEIMSRSGFSWLAVDLEHSVITIREAEELIRIIDLSGVIPLVRLSSNDSVQIKRVMDAGAHGIIVPMVNSITEAESAVASVYYPGAGRRGVGLARAQGYGESFAEYKDWQATEPVVIVQIEHIDAVNNLEGIIAVNGVDGFIVGPYDLSGSLGVPGEFDHPEMIKAMEKIREVSSQSGKARGIHVIEPDINQLEQRIEEEYRFIAYSLDIRMLSTACRQVAEVKI